MSDANDEPADGHAPDEPLIRPADRAFHAPGVQAAPPAQPERDEQRRRAAALLATIEGRLPRWKAWFPNDESMVEVPRADLLALAEVAREADKLRAAIRDARFAVMQTSGAWSIHDVSERGKAEEAKSLEVATQNVKLEVENARLRAAIRPFADNYAKNRAAMEAAVAEYAGQVKTLEHFRAAYEALYGPIPAPDAREAA